jgi:hypothetical protein
MFGKLAGAPLAAAALALSGCLPERAAYHSPTYQAPAMTAAMPGNRSCYTSDELDIVHARMAQQVFATATLGCKSANGMRRFNQPYTDFIRKFEADLALNAEGLQELADRKGLDVDGAVTEMANRTAGRMNDPGFCSRVERGLAWSLSPRVTSLRQVPPPYDFSPEMRFVPCQGARTAPGWR